jgi:hypothetical protein
MRADEKLTGFLSTKGDSRFRGEFDLINYIVNAPVSSGFGEAVQGKHPANE